MSDSHANRQPGNNDAMDRIYGRISEIANYVMRVSEQANAAHTLLAGTNGHGLLARVDELLRRIDAQDNWLRDYVSNREQTCPIAKDIEALRQYVAAQRAEEGQDHRSVLDSKTKRLVAVIAAGTALVGGLGAEIIRALLAQ